jgi:hypothetical protein
MFTPELIAEMGKFILDRQPNAVVRFRILRDVLQRTRGSSDLEAARREMLSHPWVKELADAQQADGSWGRFHSMDSTLKTRFPTSETAIRRALALGLDKDTPNLKKSVRFMENVLTGKSVWSDRVEKSEGWAIGVETITAGTLAQVDSSHPAITKSWHYWVEIAERSFPDGKYDSKAEWQAHKDLRGIGIIYLRSRYTTLTLLGARKLPSSLDRRIMEWIWNDPEGIGYLGADMNHPQQFCVFNWLESLEILSCFQSSRDVTAKAADWLWQQRDADGLWDFGSKISKSFYFPLSDDWRKPGNRSMDHSTRVLALLQKFIGEQ